MSCMGKSSHETYLRPGSCSDEAAGVCSINVAYIQDKDALDGMIYPEIEDESFC
jgi:hypothetical protein